MDEKLKAVAKVLIDRASDAFSNGSCNDFDLSEFGFTVDEMRQLVREMHAWNGDPEEADRYSDESLKWAMPDWLAMKFVLSKLCGVF